MKIKKKGKVHPSPPLPSFPSSSSSSKGDDCLSVLKLLPAVILLLVSSLSPEDKQVLAYLITRTLPTTSNTVSRSSKKKSRTLHKPPLFDCECFECYTSYWLRWDSSPNRELIHQIIEAYEDHLTKSEKSNVRGRKKSRRRGVVENLVRPEEPVASKTTEPVEPVLVVASDEVKTQESPERLVGETEMLRFPVVAAVTRHKGLARKVLPDVMGLLNSRFWRLWNPNA
ncbi:unnamed protein product [Eruca vesicaria subsp. sativa]|uniref:Uncharacterized protein n=1 Tax=Eruca vesicaria subsp. sativa TaxID=29727 RepID=A0ABC8K0M2_ERUVS|nr:unnamed protein product [Eruca vesicaria subsp. sativa]